MVRAPQWRCERGIAYQRFRESEQISLKRHSKRRNGAPEMTHTPYCKDFPYNTVNIGYKRIYVLLKSAYIQLIRVRLCIRFSVPVKRGRQEAIGGTRGYIGMGGHFEEFGGCKGFI